MTDISDVKKFEEPDAKRYPGPGAEFFAAGGFAMDLRHDYAHVLASGRERDINPSRATNRVFADYGKQDCRCQREVIGNQKICRKTDKADYGRPPEYADFPRKRRYERVTAIKFLYNLIVRPALSGLFYCSEKACFCFKIVYSTCH